MSNGTKFHDHELIQNDLSNFQIQYFTPVNKIPSTTIQKSFVSKYSPDISEL